MASSEAKANLQARAVLLGLAISLALLSPIGVGVASAAIPDTTITSGPMGWTNDPAPTFTFTADQPDTTFECRLDAEAFGPCSGDGSHAAGPLGDGSHTFEVRGSNVDGTDATPASQAFAVDTLPPETFIAFGPANDEIVGPEPAFGFSSSEDASSFQCRIDFGGWQPCTSPQMLGPLATGFYDFAVVATDSATNEDPSPAERSFEVDATPPNTQITQRPDQRSRDPRATFHFTANEPATSFQCHIDDHAWNICASPITYHLARDHHVFAVRGEDQFGNLEATPATYSFQILPAHRQPLPDSPRRRFKRIRISSVRDVRTWSPAAAHTVFAASVSGKWTIRDPSKCAAFGYEDGVRRKGWGYGRAGSRIHARFRRGVTVGRLIAIRCPRVRHRFTTIERVLRWDGRSKERRGPETSARARRGSCHFDHTFGGLTLDCWGGRYAIAKYTFGLPGDARRIHHSVDGANQCCDRGIVKKKWVKTGNGNLAYLVKATGWRAYTIRRVHMRYETKVAHHVHRRHTTFRRGYGRLG